MGDLDCHLDGDTNLLGDRPWLCGLFQRGLVEEDRPTTDVGRAIPWAGGLDGVDMGKPAKHQHSPFCFLTVDTKWPAASCSCHHPRL